MKILLALLALLVPALAHAQQVQWGRKGGPTLESGCGVNPCLNIFSDANGNGTTSVAVPMFARAGDICVAGIEYGTVSTLTPPVLSIADVNGLTWHAGPTTNGVGSNSDYFTAAMWWTITPSDILSADNVTFTGTVAIDNTTRWFACFARGAGVDSNGSATASTFGSTQTVTLSSSNAPVTAIVFAGGNTSAGFSANPLTATGVSNIQNARGSSGVNWSFGTVATQQYTAATAQTGVTVGFTNGLATTATLGMMLQANP